MRFSQVLAPAVSVLALTTGSAAFAEVTAQQVWDSWKANLGLYGAEGVTIGSETLDGGVLTVTDITIAIADDEGSVNGTLAAISFTEQGDGTVLVTMADEFPMTVTGPASDGMGEMTIALALRQTDLQLVVSGTPEAMTYDLAAARYGLDIDSLADGSVTGSGSFALNDVKGTYTVETADMQAVNYDVAAASMDIALTIDDATEATTFNLAGALSDIASNASVVMPLPENTTPETVLMDGMGGEGGYQFGTGALTFDMTQQGMPVNGNVAVDGGTLDFVISAEEVGYSTLTSGLVIEANSAMMPFPVRIGLAESGVNLLMPLSATEEPVDFALGINFTDLTLNDEIWAMFDPGAMLPRDPATFIVDLTGTGLLFVDLADPAQAATLDAMAAPGEVHSVNLNDLNLSLGGAQITGTGAFTFDNTDVTTIPGVPRPEGKVELQASGINGLIDTLVQMGLLPEEQVMGARMMLGLFTVPVGDDQLTATLEVNAEGHILANGQRLQ
jgi:hypothetical protein